MVLDLRIKSKFWGKSMEVLPVGTINVTIPEYVPFDLYNNIIITLYCMQYCLFYTITSCSLSSPCLLVRICRQFYCTACLHVHLKLKLTECTYIIPYSWYFSGVIFSWFSWSRGKPRNIYTRTCAKYVWQTVQPRKIFHELAKIATFTKILPHEKYPLYGMYIRICTDERSIHNVVVCIIGYSV